MALTFFRDTSVVDPSRAARNRDSKYPLSFAGVGKSVITKVVLNDLEDTELWVPITLIFSAQTTSGRTQEILELKLERRRRTALGAPIGKRVCVFVDDVNMPKLDTYGSQPPIELLRY